MAFIYILAVLFLFHCHLLTNSLCTGLCLYTWLVINSLLVQCETHFVKEKKTHSLCLRQAGFITHGPIKIEDAGKLWGFWGEGGCDDRKLQYMSFLSLLIP